MDRMGGGGMDRFGGGRMDRFGGGNPSRQDGGRGIGLAGRGQGGIGGSGLGPLTLVEGAKKLLQDVSGVESTWSRPRDRTPTMHGSVLT